LLEGEAPVRLGSRALEILIALIERAGELVSKNELMARVWPDTFVDEGSIKVHVAGLRRALGDGQPGRRYLANVPGRGYRFVAAVVQLEPEGPSASKSDKAERPLAHNLPASQSRVLGRADTIGALRDQLPRKRFITIVGPGGIGKTAVALALAEALLPSYEDGVRFVDLAPLSDPRLVSSTLASALGLAIHSDNALPQLINSLQDKQMLVVLDSCEHVIETTAALAEGLLAGAPGVHILATSREPLRAVGERAHRLSPLESPSSVSGLTAAEALAFPAVQLFVERAAAILDDFQLSDTDAPIIADICSKLGGIALAIELAAARMDAFGVGQLLALLDDRLEIFNQGRRTAQPRHRSLAAMLDWSYEYLPETERVILRRLSVFAGPFTLESAIAVAGDVDTDVVDGLANLVAKSLVSADIGSTSVQYRLLDTARAYAAQKLAVSGELEAYSRRHAEHHRDQVERAEAELATRSGAEWTEDYGRRRDDIRHALKWAFSANGDAAIGIALTAASLPLWMAWCLPDEGRQWAERALVSLPAHPASTARTEMKLRAALADELRYAKGLLPEIDALWTRVFELAETVGDTGFLLLRALWDAYGYYADQGDHRRAVPLAERAVVIANQNDAADARLISDALLGISLLYLGERAEALKRLKAIVDQNPTPAQPYLFFYRAIAQGPFSAALWIGGAPDQAVRHAKSALDNAMTTGNAVVVCTVLQEQFCNMAHLTGDVALAEYGAAMLLEQSARHGLATSNALARCWKGTFQLARGDPAGLAFVEPALAELREARVALPYLPFLPPLALWLAAAGQFAEAHSTIDDALERADRMGEHWMTPELLRTKGEVLRLDGAMEGGAEDYFQRALNWARRQEALSWELRAATSLAKLWRQDGKTTEAAELLSSVYNRFTEGFDTADLRTARSLVDELRNAPAPP
jgi:predicted ATPase/DNA-binding winged helix-turn-helix (wHTH) protein